jgi:anti-sigma regulatory factor (Ser/Thr protein kinase)
VEVTVLVRDTVVRVEHSSEVGNARRTAVTVAERLGFSETQTGKVALAVTELATNLVRHGGGGELIFQELTGPERGLEVVALDRGPGIADLPGAMRDGFSTAGSQGSGLGAVARQADQYDVFSLPGRGTVVLARFLREAAAAAAMTIGGVSVPHPGEHVSGDAWAAAAHSGRLSIMVADGLGHGLIAAEAAREAVRVFHDRSDAPAAEILKDTHDALRHTRGAAVAIAELHPSRELVTFVGVGNISGRLVAESTSRSLVSHAGIVGHQCRKIQEFSYPWSRSTMLVLHSDGLQTHWSVASYPGLGGKHPSLVAATLYRDHLRGRDDVTVVVAREGRAA